MGAMIIFVLFIYDSYGRLRKLTHVVSTDATRVGKGFYTDLYCIRTGEALRTCVAWRAWLSSI